MKHLHWLDTGIFPSTIMFSHNFTYDEITKLLKRKKAYDWLAGIINEKVLFESGNCLALRKDIETVKKTKQKTLLYIHLPTQFQFTDYDYCKLAHEVLHICQFMLPDILDRNKELEAEAYLHTHIMMQCLKVLRSK